MKASQLRDLTRKYAAGHLGRDEYLVERARLIDGIVHGDIEIAYRERDPAGVAAQGAGGQKHWLLAGGSVMLVGLLLVALLVYFLDDSAGASGTGQPVIDVAEEPGVELLQHFLEAGDWSDASVRQLEEGWMNLTPFEQESARRSSGYRRLKHETTRRISEQEALLATGEMEALLRATRLRAFAERLGIPSRK